VEVPEIPSKYGAALTAESWNGLPLRVGAYAGNGRTEGLVAEEDTILLWSGGLSEVTIQARASAGQTKGRVTLHFERRGGMVDFLPRGTALDEISWRGKAHGCLSVSLERSRLEPLFGGTVPSFVPERDLRINVVDGHIVDLVRRLESQAVQGEAWSTLYVQGLSLTLASYVYGRHASGAPTRAAPRLPLSATEMLVAYVEDHLGEDVSLTAIARRVGFTADHLARAFKRSFGVSIHQYVLHRRVERAKALLRDRSHSIAEVALACGFATQSHFTSVFKSRTGLTPRAYRGW
jgi:AraC family transcriptional regulator